MILNISSIIPLLLSFISIYYTYIYSKKVLIIEKEAERKNLVYKYQFEKEFQIYVELWEKLIELRNSTAKLRPTIDVRDRSKTEDEIKNDRLEIQYFKFNDVLETFEKNRPFYSKEIYIEVDSLIKIARFEAIDYQYKEHDRNYWKQAELNIKTIVNTMDKIADLIRRRIEFVEVSE